MIGLLRGLCVVALLALTACSIDSQASPAATQVVQPAAVEVQSERELPGRLLYVHDHQIWQHVGASARPLPLEGDVRDPAWSPDGRWIAYIRRQESFADLYIMNTASGKSTQITFNGRSDLEARSQDYVHQVIWAAEPTWAPGSNEFVFLSQEQPATGPDEQPPIFEYPLVLYRYPLSLVGTRQPTNEDLLPVGDGQSDLLSPAWSPDGRYLAYVEVPRGTGPRRIMLYDFTQQTTTAYPGIPEGAYDPAWSPDGQMLAFAAKNGAATDVWIVDGPGSTGAPQRITSLGQARAPVWAPDGQAIGLLHLGETSTDLYLVELQQENGQLTPGEPIQITRNTDIDATAGLSWSD